MERAIEVAEAEDIEELEGEGAVMRHINYFDRKQRGRITLFDTFVCMCHPSFKSRNIRS
jgi:hypothetical protein